MCSDSSTIKLSSNRLRNFCEVSNMHLLPCKIQRNGEAKVDEYFQCGVKYELDGEQKGLRVNCNMYRKASEVQISRLGYHLSCRDVSLL